MSILLLRHAEATPEGSSGDDAMRWLTAKGREQAREVARAVRERGLSLARFVASPRVRAVQTAELIAQGAGFSGVVEVLPALSFTEPAERAAREIGALAEGLASGAVLVAVGHMPTLAETAARLTGGGHQSGFSLAEALLIEAGKVVWSATPATRSRG